MGHSVSGCWAEGADGTRKEEEWGGGEASGKVTVYPQLHPRMGTALASQPQTSDTKILPPNKHGNQFERRK